MEPEIAELEDYFTYNSETREINYDPSANERYDFRSFTGESKILVKLYDSQGREEVIEMMLILLPSFIS